MPPRRPPSSKFRSPPLPLVGRGESATPAEADVCVSIPVPRADLCSPADGHLEGGKHVPGPERLVAFFERLPDPRVRRTRSHPLRNVVVIACLGVIAGCQGWDDLHDWGVLKHSWLSTFLTLTAGIPCADTFRRVFEALRPKAFRACFDAFVQALLKVTTGTTVLAVDGKTLRRSFHSATARTPLHLVHAWVAALPANVA
jgi:hypothetical protein